MKFPFIKFFPTDWLAEPALRACSVGARGLWMDMLSLMHLAPRRGYLLAATGLPISPEQLARMTGCSADEVVRLLGELQTSGAFSCTDDGMIYSRRMVREETKREKCSDAGRKGGGNPTFKGSPKGGAKGAPKGESKPLEARVQTLEPPTPDDEPDELDGPQPSTSRPPRIADVIDYWNSQAKLPKVKARGPSWARFLTQLAAIDGFCDGGWRAAIDNLAASPYHRGENDNGWTATLDWLLKPDNYVKAANLVVAAPGGQPAKITTLADLDAVDMKLAPPKRLFLQGNHHVG